MVRLLRLAPGTQRIGGAADERVIDGRAITPHQQLHVDVSGLGVAKAFAACEQLLQRVRQQLIRRGVLAAAEQFACRDLVQDSGQFVGSGFAC